MKKIREMIKKVNNAKGFTLVELLAVIVILGIIVAIAVPAIGSIISDSKGTASEAQIELIIDAARLAHANGEFTDTITTSELQEKGYLEISEASSSESSFQSGTVTYKASPAEGENTFTFSSGS